MPRAACEPTCGDGCGNPSCTRCGGRSKHIVRGAEVETALGLVGTVLSVDDCYATVELYDKCVVKVTKASICKVLRISLAVGTWVRIRTGHIGKISKLTDRLVTIEWGDDMTLHFDRDAVCEIVDKPE
jgi:preprotein translocase subunit YajC